MWMTSQACLLRWNRALHEKKGRRVDLEDVDVGTLGRAEGL